LSVQVDIILMDPSQVIDLVSFLNGVVVGGQNISVTLLNSTTEQHALVNKKLGTVDVPHFSGSKRIPERFRILKSVPKLVDSAAPRTYATLLDDSVARESLVDMLKELMRLQKRAIAENNTKAKKRLVMGLRETNRSLRAHKAKMVVMANNLDDYGVIDEKLQEILDMAEEQEIPILFELSKRALGKAIGKPIKVAVIAVQNADGANQQFKKLATMAKRVKADAHSDPFAG
jgi:selenocysteine insertion sequence-binding protein 2